MNFLVPGKGIPFVEGLPTLTAFIGLFSRVDSLLLDQFVLVDEGLATGSASVGPLSTVNSLVLNEADVVPEHFPHSLHSQGFSPLWILWCSRSLFWWLKAFPHS